MLCWCATLWLDGYLSSVSGMLAQGNHVSGVFIVDDWIQRLRCRHLYLLAGLNQHIGNSKQRQAARSKSFALTFLDFKAAGLLKLARAFSGEFACRSLHPATS